MYETETVPAHGLTGATLSQRSLSIEDGEGSALHDHASVELACGDQIYLRCEQWEFPAIVRNIIELEDGKRLILTNNTFAKNEPGAVPRDLIELRSENGHFVRWLCAQDGDGDGEIYNSVELLKHHPAPRYWRNRA